MKRILIRAINPSGVSMFFDGNGWTPDHKSAHDYQCQQIAEDLLVKVQPFKGMVKLGFSLGVVKA